jgi:hypothetical protein
VNVDDLLSMDKMFLLMKVREVSYGENYDLISLAPLAPLRLKLP